MTKCLELRNVTYRYEGSRETVLQKVNAEFEHAKVYTIIGESGAGKSTLLSLLSGLDTCQEGDIYYNGTNLRSIDRDIYRSQRVGVIFQSYNLLLNSTALYNITLSMSISESKIKGRQAKKQAAYALLAKMGLDRETSHRKILELSGGEQQRVGIARALAHNPDVIIADEPTGNLDAETEQAVLAIFTRLAHEEGKCVIIVTHSESVTAIADEVLSIQEGQLSKLRRG
ncbi:MAG: ATP-binding cassette domain-containing protein [Symbiobacteriaceae bacterium]|nr:ATP-binding cassette domain-containing protein [Symbiobacteriaceae bacterium]